MDQQSQVPHSLSFLYVQVKDYKSMLKLSSWPRVFTSYKAKEVWSWSPCSNIGMIFTEKHFLRYILSTDRISLSACFYFLNFVCFPVCDIMNFEIYLSFLIKPFSTIFKGLSLKQIKLTFLERESPTWSNFKLKSDVKF